MVKDLARVKNELAAGEYAVAALFSTALAADILDLAAQVCHLNKTCSAAVSCSNVCGRIAATSRKTAIVLQVPVCLQACRYNAPSALVTWMLLILHL